MSDREIQESATASVVATVGLANALDGLLTSAGWRVLDPEGMSSHEVSCYLARKALWDAHDAGLLVEEPYCMDDRAEPSPEVAYALKTNDHWSNVYTAPTAAVAASEKGLWGV